MPVEQEVNSGGRIELECAAEGIPTPIITWKVNGSDIPSKRIGLSNQTMSILILGNVLES